MSTFAPCLWPFGHPPLTDSDPQSPPDPATINRSWRRTNDPAEDRGPGKVPVRNLCFHCWAREEQHLDNRECPPRGTSTWLVEVIGEGEVGRYIARNGDEALMRAQAQFPGFSKGVPYALQNLSAGWAYSDGIVRITEVR